MQTISLNFVLLSLKIQAKQAMNHTNSIVKTTTLKSPKSVNSNGKYCTEPLKIKKTNKNNSYERF